MMKADIQHYANLLSDIKSRICDGQIRAARAVNQQLVQLYWDIGKMIYQRQTEQGWGAKVIPRLAIDIANELPEVKGFSQRNLLFMLQFFCEFKSDLIMKQLVSQLPWSHVIILIQRIKDQSARHWYAEQIVKLGWSRNTLSLMIKTDLFARQGSVISNFDKNLHAAQATLAQATLKDPYIFDFLTLTDTFKERQLEVELIKHLEKFLLELGAGFAYVGRQYPISIDEQDYYIDLLFYHLKLRAYIVIELKRGDFKPEYAGKMNFYCSVVDDILRHPDDQPTIGLILCQSKNKLLAEYALRGIQQPIGVSDYELTKALPEDLKSSLPSIEALEELLDGQ